MTPLALLHHLQASGVELTPSPDGSLRCRAPQGVLTPPLVEAMRMAKAALVALLTEGPPQAATVAPDYRQWQTGRVPQTSTGIITAPLPPPKYHDTPKPCRTSIGRPCPKKACKGHRTRFSPSGLCTSCWERAKKITRASDATW
jgi:hypothetical protein